ncbi:MAG: hypothetical protein R3B90_08405 [Planctomycetaceae bacterium]
MRAAGSRTRRGTEPRPAAAGPQLPGKVAAYSVATARGKIPERKQGEQVLGRSVRTEQYRFTEWGDGGQYGVELYDYDSDPDEYANLTQIEGHESIIARMSELLRERIRWEDGKE